MLSSFLVALVLNCPSVKLVNHTQSWTAKDKYILNSASKRCQELYSQSPCLKKFIKKEELVYNAVCGKEVK